MHTFATTYIIVWELYRYSLGVRWGVVAISRLMSTSFEPDRVTGPFGNREMPLALIVSIYKFLAKIEKCQQPEKC